MILHHHCRGGGRSGLNTIPCLARFPRKYRPTETVSGLGCSYGAFAYSRSPRPEDRGHLRPLRPGCPNSVEPPNECRRCNLCGGVYCAAHAEPAAHDCASVIRPQ